MAIRKSKSADIEYFEKKVRKAQSAEEASVNNKRLKLLKEADNMFHLGKLATKSLTDPNWIDIMNE